MSVIERFNDHVCVAHTGRGSRVGRAGALRMVDREFGSQSNQTDDL